MIGSPASDAPASGPAARVYKRPAAPAQSPLALAAGRWPLAAGRATVACNIETMRSKPFSLPDSGPLLGVVYVLLWLALLPTQQPYWMLPFGLRFAALLI